MNSDGNSCRGGQSRLHQWLLISAAAGALLAPGAAFAQDEDNGAGVGIADIVVTAQRREEKLQNVPIAVTAITADGLRERGVTNLQDMQASVPSLVVGPNGQASRDVMSPSIRGQSALFQGAPAVVVYMNEVPLPSATTLSSQGGPGTFVDLQNVQVLSGAQGTLFGRNTTGGAILLTAAKPTDQLEGYLQGGYGNYNMTEFEAVLNIPLSDTLRVRLVGSSRDRDGFTYDVNWNKDRDDQHWRMARVGIDWTPTENISSYTMFNYGYSKTNGTGSVGKAFNLNVYGYLNSLPYGYNFDLGYLQDQIDQQESLGIRKVAHGLDDFSRLITWGISNNTEFQLSEGLKLRNIASYSSLKSYYAGDGDGTTAPIYDTGVTVESRLSPRDYFETYTEELQLQGDLFDHKLTFSAGGFYYKQKPGGTMNAYAINVCDEDEPSDLCSQSRSSLSVTNESKALYAQTTVDLGLLTPSLDRVRFTAGYRYTWDKVSGSNTSYSYIPAYGIATGCSWDATLIDPMVGVSEATARELCKFSSARKDSAGTWTLGLDYRPIDNLLLYAKATRGYKAGGFNAYAVFPSTRTFGPETVTDYEAGFKSDFHVGSAPARLNVNGFWLDYKNIQRAGPDFNPATFGNGAITLSTASATIRGVEVQTMIKPVRELELGANYSYTDAFYRSFKFVTNSPIYDCTATSPASPLIPAGGTADETCRPLQYMSPHILSVYGRVSLPVGDNAGDLSLFVNYSYTAAQNTAPLYEETFPDGSTLEPGVRLPSFGLVNASLDWKNALNSGLDATLFVNNLTNKNYLISNTGVYGSVGAQSVMYGEPRMYGMRLRYKFGG